MGAAGASLTKHVLIGRPLAKPKLAGVSLKPPKKDEAPAAGANSDEGESDWSPSDNKRSPRRQYFSAHIHAAGPRPVLEALIAVHEGASLDEVLEDFARIPAEAYHLMGASHFQEQILINGSSTTWLLRKK